VRTIARVDREGQATPAGPPQSLLRHREGNPPRPASENGSRPVLPGAEDDSVASPLGVDLFPLEEHPFLERPAGRREGLPSRWGEPSPLGRERVEAHAPTTLDQGEESSREHGKAAAGAPPPRPVRDDPEEKGPERAVDEGDLPLDELGRQDLGRRAEGRGERVDAPACGMPPPAPPDRTAGDRTDDGGKPLARDEGDEGIRPKELRGIEAGPSPFSPRGKHPRPPPGGEDHPHRVARVDHSRVEPAGRVGGRATADKSILLPPGCFTRGRPEKGQ
jgi:hypothetical protein